MAAKQDGWTDLVKLLALSATILVPLVGLILYQGYELRSEIRDLRTEMRAEFRDLRETLCELRVTVARIDAVAARIEGLVARIDTAAAGIEGSVVRIDAAVARIQALDSLHLRLAERFAASGEGASYGGPRIAAGLLLARALPEIDAVLSAIDQGAQSELAKDLWEDRANILARASPVP